MTYFQIAQLCLLGLCCGAISILLLREVLNRAAFRQWTAHHGEKPLVLLFEKGVLIDANGAATTFLGNQEIHDVTWAHVRSLLTNHISSLPITLGRTKAPVLNCPKTAKTGDVRATLEQWDNLAKLSIYNWPSQAQKKNSIKVPVTEFEALTLAAMEAPFPIWKLSPNGNVIWANTAFFAECGMPVFAGAHPQRLSFTIPDNLKSGDSFPVSFVSHKHNVLRHYDVTMIRRSDVRMFYAFSADKIVRAEAESKEFIQTLSKTFAQLSTGLAIFDKERRLVLFNPALMDQFDLPPEFLETEPTLAEFFDRLRAGRMIPEPRNYDTWREQITRLVLDASDDKYREIWPLPSGETFKVTGRPHPNGAVAFLFEDISAELSLERRFRSELDLTRAIIDNLNHAIAVISPGGQFAMTNAAFRTYWRVDPDSSLAKFTWYDFEKIWKIQVKESHILKMTSNYLRLYHYRKPWARDITLESGGSLQIQAEPIAGGYTILTFIESQPEPVNVIQKLAAT